MDYQEFSSNKSSTYEKLLASDEWKEKRNKILFRDNYYCTRCYTTSSMWYLDKHITFTKGELIQTEKVIKANLQLDYFKEQFDIEKIDILKHPEHSAYLCGISDNKILSVVNYQHRNFDISKEPAIDLVLLENGLIMPVINFHDLDILNKKPILPKLHPEPFVLHVHHKFYIKDKLPWNYQDESLTTLCNWCHWNLHEKTKVPIYRKNSSGELIELSYTPCLRCNGAGIFPEYKHVQNGICFRCNGEKYEELI